MPEKLPPSARHGDEEKTRPSTDSRSTRSFEPSQEESQAVQSTHSLMNVSEPGEIKLALFWSCSSFFGYRDAQKVSPFFKTPSLEQLHLHPPSMSHSSPPKSRIENSSEGVTRSMEIPKTHQAICRCFFRALGFAELPCGGGTRVRKGWPAKNLLLFKKS